MIETYLLEQFDAFVRNGTLLKASKELHISQPTLSRSMKKLESELGVSIFNRENNRLSLNETGEVTAEYVRRALRANQDIIDHVVSFDRSLKTISIGSCAPFPLNALIPDLQMFFPKKAILTELMDDEYLINGLKNNQYNLVILHNKPEDASLFSKKFIEEQLYISLPADHFLASRERVNFSDLQNLKILVTRQIGFWMSLCRKYLSDSNLLIQTDMNSLSELVEASSLPFFNSDQMIKQGYTVSNRVSIPISDQDAKVTYWITTKNSEWYKYRELFNNI